jgi:hypothetical protein
MAIPELVRRQALTRVEAYCQARVPAQVRDQVRNEAGVRGDAITIFECRPPWRDEYGPEWTRRKIAQFRYQPATSRWSVWWADRNGRWLAYPSAPATREIDTLIAAVEHDQSGAFWG